MDSLAVTLLAQTYPFGPFDLKLKEARMTHFGRGGREGGELVSRVREVTRPFTS